MSIFWLYFFLLIGGIHGIFRPTNEVEQETEHTKTSFPTECGVQHYNPASESSPSGPQGYIVGGFDANTNSWPWQVMLLENDSLICGGTLIDTRHVLTAAHCFNFTYKAEYKVVVSMHDVDRNPEAEEMFGIESIWLHEQYDTVTSENDIAVLRLKKPVTISDKVNVICLPGAEAINANEEVWVVGWGATKYEGGTSQVLKQALLYTMPKSCPRVYRDHNYDAKKQMCAGRPNGKHDACQGDSGGPLMYQKKGVWYLNGVVSYGFGCGEKETPGVYARVSYYLTWIRTKLQTPSRKKNTRF